MRNNLFLGVAAAALVAPMGAMAQETTSTIRGTVTAGGAPVAGASVTVVNVPSGTTSTVTTDAAGSFNAAGLRVGGPFSVTVAAPGYPETTITDIFTVAAQAYEVPIELAPAETGDAGGEIVVTASRLPNARTVSQGPATVLSATDIGNIATVNRDIRDLSRRDPFARLDDSPTGGRAISFAGQNARYNRFSVDGVPITDNFGLNTDGLPSRRSPIPLDAIGQFQAKVAPYDVREGNFQGGAINIVLKSGTNAFHGTGFYSQTNDSLVGKRTKPGPGIPTGRSNVPDFKLENYGLELSGPIIKDKLFFMVAGERLRGGRPIAEGPTDNNAGTSVLNLTQAQIDGPNGVETIARDVYNYDAGGVLRNLGDKDDRVVARIDANLADTQRLSLTYTYANDAINLLNNTFPTAASGSPGLGLASNAYIQGNRLHTGVVQLNSEWSDSFSTEIRGFYKNYKRIQDPVLGRGFAQFRVCTDPTNPVGGSLTSCSSTGAVVALGPDNSRQTNALNTQTWGGLVQARLTMNDHDLRVFGEFQTVDVFNSFLQNSAGNYYFDSIDDFKNQRANQIAFGTAIPSLQPDDAAAQFSYQSFTFGIMDRWRLTDTLNISYGMRYDLYAQHSQPAFSPFYTQRYGNGAIVDGQRVLVGPNTVNISGFNLFQPRFGFDWKPLERVSIRGGVGIFGGGTPDVYVSNSFSNPGITINQTGTISRTSAPGAAVTTCNNATVTAAGLCGTALNGVTGTSVPGALGTYLANNTGALSASTVNAIDNNFRVPSQWRGTLSAEYTGDLGPLGDGWTIGADLLFSKVRQQVYFTDIRSVPVTTAANALTPDGRVRYQNAIDGAGSTNTNQDILLTNTDQGRSFLQVARFEKSWDFGLEIYGAYTHASVKDRAPATSSTAGSNYSNGAFVDPNNVAYGISNDQVKHSFKYGVTFDHAFFGDAKTSIALFGETRSGHPFSYTFQNVCAARSTVFGVSSGCSSATSVSGNRYLMYVPDVSDPRVQYSSADFANKVNAFIDSSGLAKYRGKVAPRNGFTSPWFTRFDLHLAQEVPIGFAGARIQVFGDIENFTNFLNRKWGQLREYVFPYNAPVVQVSCLTTAGNATPTAGAPTGTVATSVAQPCAQYRYSPLNQQTDFVSPVDQVYVNQSLYTIRIGARITF